MALPTTVTFSDEAVSGLEADVLVVAAAKKDDTVSLVDGHGLSEEQAETVAHVLGTVGAEAGAEEVTRIPGLDDVSAPLIMVVGLPEGRSARTERLRRAAGVAARSLAGRGRAVFSLGQSDRDEAVAVAEGVVLGGYSFQEHHGVGKKEKDKAPLGEAVVVGLSGADAESALTDANAVAGAVSWARDLVNTPPNALYPESFAGFVSERASGSSVEVEVWDKEKLTAEGCGGIIGVGQGSARDPRLVTMRYAPEGAKAHLALVGKGITFDSGGLCIKPAGSMVTMKCDMGGAAAVAAATLAIAELGLPVQVTAFLCMAENMTGDLAQRPGDVVTMRDGRTVEIINTDAEGRLVMADGLALATEAGPDAIVDVATLTGACQVALGDRTIGVMGNDDELRDSLVELGTAAGDNAWALPMPEELRPTLDCGVADLKHTGDRVAGAMVAATFLQEFVGKRGEGDDAEQINWAHLDIAGPAFNDKAAWGYYPKGGTGSGTRSLIALARKMAG